MALYSWPNCPTPTQQQLRQFIGKLETSLTNNLIGIYLHGSLAMGSFNPERSDLDLLVVTRRPMSLEIKHMLAETLLSRSGQPHPIEISFLRRDDMVPWQYPTPFDFHYSEMWRESFQCELTSGGWKSWNDSQRYDPDLAAHITITNHRGLRLAGVTVKEVFPAVPRQDYLDSILGDVRDGLEHITGNPVYGILNACRTYAYLRHGYISSKEEGGVWALEALPESLRGVVMKALAIYRGEPEVTPLENNQLETFAAYIRTTLTSLLPEMS
jgi:streptomycin 3"-adenylyltransferase